ncbi:MAG TPA: hypothetical protein DDY77_04370 [Clostridiales bacterium]|nr:hypothetical protein [Clostridiales bacterium]
MELYNKIEEIFYLIVNYCILFIELVGVGVLVYTIIKSVIALFKKTPRLRLDLAEGIALSLEFKMGGELLRTVVVREWKELVILGAIILMRAAMTFLIQWEIKNEKKENAVLKNDEHKTM